jgi:GH35 family endo-1,4-beta-xylanase
MRRRNFINKTLLGASGTLMAPLMASANQASPAKFLHGFSTDSSVLDQAKQNIEKIRKGDAMVQLLGKDGSPLKNREVEVEQLSHQFLFGDNNWTMAAMVRNGMEDTDRLKYFRKRFVEALNTLNATVYWTERPQYDAVKTQDFQGEVEWDSFEESVSWALSQGLTVKGHPMYWTVPKALPEWLKKYPYETHMKFVEVRIRNLAARFKNRVKIWDAVNEMLWEPHPKNLAERHWPYLETIDNMVDYISKVIGWGREEDPNALFTINDYGLSMTKNNDLRTRSGTLVTAASQRLRYIELIQRLGDVGVSPNLMGIQCHTGWLSPSEQMTFYDEMSTAGIPLTVTEFWANTNELKKMPREKVESEEWRSLGNIDKYQNLSDDELAHVRDEYVLNYLTCAFGHPNINSFYFWGFMGMGLKFKNDYNSGHEVQPIFTKVSDLINKEWHTSLKLKSDRSGTIAFRGFHGDYALKIKPGDRPSVGHTITIDQNQALSSFTLKTVL